MYVYVCEDSIEGIFTGVYEAWASGYGHSNVRLISKEVDNMELFSEYIYVVSDSDKSLKVTKTLCTRLGFEAYEMICKAIISDIEDRRNKVDKAEAVYRTIVQGLHMKDGRKVMENLADPYIAKVFKLSRGTNNECAHLMGFLRFRELSNGMLFAKINPHNDILPVLASHFTDRLPNENFVIYDEGRKSAAVHKKSYGFVQVDASDIDEDVISSFSEEEETYEKLWIEFFNTIAIVSRNNAELQRQNIPKRFWKNTVELKDKV